MAQPEVIKDIDARVKKSGDTMTGNLQGKYFQGTWLQTTDITDLNSSSSKIAVISNDGWIYYRTPSELASDIGLTSNYVLKSGGTMTGNLTAPKFIGQLQGNASSSTYSTYTCFQDTRNVNEMPLDMLKGISLHLKSNSTDGLNDGLSYHPVLMLRDWNDLTGGPFAELTITGNQNLYFRSSIASADNTWNPWRKVLTDYNYTSILNNTYLPLTGGTLTGQLKFTQSNGIQTRHIDGESTTFAGDLYLNYRVNAPVHLGHGGAHYISADGAYYSGTSNASNYLQSQGVMTALSGTARYSTGLRIGRVYSSGYPFSYGTTLTMEDGSFGAELIFNGLGGGGATGSGSVYFRTHSDWNTSEWGEWKILLDSKNYTNYISSGPGSFKMYVDSLKE